MSHTTISTLVLAMIATTVLAARADAGEPLPVTVCGQTIKGAGELTGNLDCTGSPTINGVNIDGGSLAMNGFTITGGLAGVECHGPCRITGPGTITQASYGINGKGKLDVRAVSVTSNTLLGIQCFVGCRVSGPASISDNGQPDLGYSVGVSSPGGLKIDNVTISGNWGSGARATNPSDTGSLTVRNSVVTGNTYGLYADHLAKVVASTVAENTEAGIIVGDPGCAHAGRAKIKSSTVTGNGTDGGCGVTAACADLMTCREPKLTGSSSCDTSYVSDSGIPGTSWGVCASD